MTARIVDLLSVGRENAVTARELADRLGTKDIRTVSLMVEWARKDGLPICASCDKDRPGYFLASGPEDLAAYLKSLDRRLLNTRRTRERLGITLANMIGQQRIGVL